jgi:taurine dioxygenase
MSAIPKDASSTLAVDHLSPNLGTVVTNVDLSSPTVLEEKGDELRSLLQERQVLFFRDQSLSPEAQINFASLYGAPREVVSTFEHHPENDQLEILRSIGKPIGTDVWHTDLSWHPQPPAATCLYGVDVPPVGGDTVFASMICAFDSLSRKMQDYVSQLTALHNWENTAVSEFMKSKEGGYERYQSMRRDHPPLERPVVETHPVTGKKVIYVNSLYSTRILGISQSESDSLLRFLCGLATVPEWQVRFRWQPGSLAIWDNWAVQHYAVNDYHPNPRVMHRVTVT